jgi:hypothetical protein
MDMQKSTLSRVEATVRSTYRQIFAIDEPQLVMPQSQINLFADKALHAHMLVAVTMRNLDTSIVGHFTHMLNENTLLFRNQATNIDHIIPLSQCTFIQRVEA